MTLLRANAKINIGLYITCKRSDGFHDIATVYYPIALYDELFINCSDTFLLKLSGIAIDGTIEDNILFKIYQYFRTHFAITPIQILLHKKIPTGAGLGGGSSDAATLIIWINSHFQLGLHTHQLISIASKFGSDIAFFLLNQCCYGIGKGDILEPLDISLVQYTLILIKPIVHCNTATAYQYVSITDNHPLRQNIMLPISEWRNNISNEFEKSVFNQYPEIAIIKNKLYQNGAIYASMSGSGSTVYGLFHCFTDIPTLLSKLSLTDEFVYIEKCK